MRNDLTIYSRYAHEWWIKGAPHFRSLQNLTPFRLALIDEFVGDLSGKKVLDLGCGGGLISVPLIERGAIVTGIDQSNESIKAAQIASHGRGTFVTGDIHKLNIDSGTMDCVILADVLDHIPHFGRVLREASRTLRKGGRLFAGTLNRNQLSHFLTITLGESLGFIPKGTHNSQLFIRPHELKETAGLCGLECKKLQGEWPVFFETILRRAITLRRSKSLLVAYSAVFEKVTDEE